MIERQLGLGFVLVVFVSWFDVVVLLVEAVVAEPKVVVLVGEFGGVIMDEEFVDANVAAEVLGLVEQGGLEFGDRNGANVVGMGLGSSTDGVIVVDAFVGHCSATSAGMAGGSNVGCC